MMKCLPLGFTPNSENEERDSTELAGDGDSNAVPFPRPLFLLRLTELQTCFRRPWVESGLDRIDDRSIGSFGIVGFIPPMNGSQEVIENNVSHFTA